MAYNTTCLNSLSRSDSLSCKWLVSLCSSWHAEEDGLSRATSAEQSEIVNKHNELRRGVKPTASNMLKMVSLWRQDIHLLLFIYVFICFFFAVFFISLFSFLSLLANLFLNSKKVAPLSFFLSFLPSFFLSFTICLCSLPPFIYLSVPPPVCSINVFVRGVIGQVVWVSLPGTNKCLCGKRWEIFFFEWCSCLYMSHVLDPSVMLSSPWRLFSVLT